MFFLINPNNKNQKRKTTAFLFSRQFLLEMSPRASEEMRHRVVLVKVHRKLCLFDNVLHSDAKLCIHFLKRTSIKTLFI